MGAEASAAEAVRDSALWFEPGPAGEFYRIRADLTAALIERKRFNLVAAGRAGFYGLDLYSLHVVAQLVDLRKRAVEYASRDGFVAEDEYFFAEQNARLVRNAGQYYRSMFGRRAESWNIRDTHMMETLDALVQWTRRRSGDARAVVWAHNSHLGDAHANADGTVGRAQPRPARPPEVRERCLPDRIHDPYRDRHRCPRLGRARRAATGPAVDAGHPLERWSREEADLSETHPSGV